MKSTYSIITVGLSLLLLVTGCGSDQIRQSSTEHSDIPKWALTPPPACGIGIAKHRGSLGMAQQTAVARGRDSLAR